MKIIYRILVILLWIPVVVSIVIGLPICLLISLFIYLFTGKTKDLVPFFFKKNLKVFEKLLDIIENLAKKGEKE